mmetsp:Transcript_43159/g.97539  ORF Transcript_43159/g.97539 Transcript_43159/m.97539 type:complete len:369 (-) Transcript_43159:37-1143(-)|eukprot:CAMPEP_0172621406 /NCGR_PEP_ID=MMETSP1068-20121228/111989_1 /TAXON_ID=35684 /ORGANISM="Pseudopedinella elastica, Strain CCMP716" /LENGTH=368 /DNA_ID=CAMNT_0013429155 /DNA_START=82 /DNA_END=1188 /DNA_ORIENTATION=+
MLAPRATERSETRQLEKGSSKSSVSFGELPSIVSSQAESSKFGDTNFDTNATIAGGSLGPPGTRLQKLVKKINKNHEKQRYLNLVTSKGLPKEESDEERVQRSNSLTPPYPIRGERSRLSILDMIRAAEQNRSPECQIYHPELGKFLAITVNVNTGTYKVVLIEGDRLWPARDCGVWRLLPADRTAPPPKKLLLQNVFSNKYLGHDRRGQAQCFETIPTAHEHLTLEADAATGRLKIVCPHWHWEAGSPFVVKGMGKRNPPLWPNQTGFIEASGGKYRHSENPPRTLRCGYGGQSDKSKHHVPALFQVVWDLPPQSKRAPAGYADLGREHVDLNWLGQKTVDFHAGLNTQRDPAWRSPHKARELGLLP